MEQTKIPLLTKCDACGRKFIVEPRMIKQEQEMEGKGEKIYLTYYECPGCGKIYKILLDNNLTLVLKKQYQNQIYKMQLIKSRYKGTALQEKVLKQQDVINKKKKKLERAYKILEKRYPGDFVYIDETNNITENKGE